MYHQAVSTEVLLCAAPLEDRAKQMGAAPSTVESKGEIPKPWSPKVYLYYSGIQSAKFREDLVETTSVKNH